MPHGVVYAINDRKVSQPEEVVWTPISIGVAGSGRQKRSPYWFCEWRKQVDDSCDLEWHDYDNTTLSSFTSTIPTSDIDYARYTDAICQSVGHRKMRGISMECVARFLVYVGA